MRPIGHRTFPRVATGLALLAAVAMPGVARAVQLDYTCGIAAQILSNGDERLQFSLAGETVGTVGMIANLACFVGDGRCSCLRRATDGDRDESTRFSQEVGRIIAGCFDADPSRSLSGISQEAVLNICR
jgi:hypothetical protein